MKEQYTIYDLAERLGVTPSMVSRAFNPSAKIAEEKRKLILDEAKKHGFVPNRFASRLSMKNIRIGVLMVYKAKHVRDALLAGINSAYEKMRDYKIQCVIKTVSASEKNAKDCRDELFSFSDFDGVILSGFGNAECKELIASFTEKNPNIVFLQSVCDDVQYLFASKQSEKLSANIAAELISARLHYSERKNVILFTGDRRSSVHSKIKEAFFEACESAGMTIIDDFDMKDSESCLKERLPDVFAKFGDETDAIYISSGISAELCQYVEALGKDITLVVTDLHSDVCRYIENGTVFAGICQNFAEQGKQAFEKLVAYIIDRELPEKILYSESTPVFRANLELYRNK